MKNTWDLSFLYKSFEDEAFQADLARLPEAIAEEKALLDSDLPVQEKLEKLMDADEALSTLMDRLFNFAGLTLATDANNGTAQQYEDKLSVIANRISGIAKRRADGGSIKYFFTPRLFDRGDTDLGHTVAVGYMITYTVKELQGLGIYMTSARNKELYAVAEKTLAHLAEKSFCKKVTEPAHFGGKR